MIIEEIKKAREQLIRYAMELNNMSVEPNRLVLNEIIYDQLKEMCKGTTMWDRDLLTRVDRFMDMEIKVDNRLRPNVVKVEDTKHDLHTLRELPNYYNGFRGGKRPLNDHSLDAMRYCKEDIENTMGLYNIHDWIRPVDINKLPKKYIINQDACILFWDNDSKTVVKRAEDDKQDPVKGFLWAYFIKKSGMSRTKANKYLREIQEAYELVNKD